MEKKRTPQREERIREVLEKRQKDLTLIVDNVWDPHNVSAILRSCDAFGIYGIHLYYTDAEWPDFANKSSASGKKWVERTTHTDAAEMVGSLRGKGYQVLRTGFSENARPLMDFDLSKPSAVILSNEHSGTAPELAALVPDEVYIPMQGMIQSFNVSVAAGLILYHGFTQRYAKGMYDKPSFSQEEMDVIVQDWLTR
ncbi:RNA methyltransferase [Maridesulfovibrio ferrireducens]|uniref:TrmH family RNA methyltransferase n=1 Tax=Maridesulfovibrio ferrireducens TaxID=246191 RepID=UPI001A1C811D|nr:RNA methyltransferase [Maridesulfovibrio ferrireducens]MBI9112151.1 RNA methyltransferase [Maridesulfovibrio ferrireducens]